MFTYLLNKNAYAFKISSEVADLDIEKMKANGVTFFDDEGEFKKVWSAETGISIEELECSEYLISKDTDGRTVAVCDRGFIMDYDESCIEDFVINFVM